MVQAVLPLHHHRQARLSGRTENLHRNLIAGAPNLDVEPHRAAFETANDNVIERIGKHWVLKVHRPKR